VVSPYDTWYFICPRPLAFSSLCFKPLNKTLFAFSSSAIILVHSSPLTHVKIGCVNPCLNNIPSTKVYLAAFLLIFLPSSGSAGRIPSARYHL